MTVRAVDWTGVLAGSVLTAGLVGLALGVPATFPAAAWAALAGVAAAVAFTLDDPAAQAATPPRPACADVPPPGSAQRSPR